MVKQPEQQGLMRIADQMLRHVVDMDSGTIVSLRIHYQTKAIRHHAQKHLQMAGKAEGDIGQGHAGI